MCTPSSWSVGRVSASARPSTLPADVPIEWVIAGMVSIITVLSTAVTVLWRNHLATDERERLRTNALETELKGIIADLRTALRKGAGR